MSLTTSEFRFGLLVASAHGGQHVFYRLIPPLIPILVVVFDLPLWQLGLLVGIYSFAGGLFQAPMGILSDRYDRRFILPPGFGLMGSGYLIFAAAGLLGTAIPTIQLTGYEFTGEFVVMALGMFVAGTGFSVVHPVGYPLISSNVSPERKGRILGFWGSASKFGDAAAPLFVGLLILVLAWDQILYAFGIFGFVYGIVLYIVLSMDHIDTMPAGRSIKSSTEANSNESGLPADNREFLFPMILIVLFFFAVSFAGQGLNTFTPVYIIDVYGFEMNLLGITFEPASVANLYFSVLLISGGITQLFIGPLTDRYEHRSVLLGLLVISTAGLLVLVLLPLTPLTLLGTVIIIGCSLYGINPARDALMSDITPANYEGRTFGYVWTLAMIASAIYPVIIGYIADTSGLRASFTYLVIGTVMASVFIAALFSDRIYYHQDSGM